MITAKPFYMIRHGETEANAKRIMAGSLDSPLTETGRSQAKTIHAILEHLEIKPETIAHSHLSRARDTAQIINAALNVPFIEDNGLAELYAGDWEGVPYEDCPNFLDGWSDPPNGETFADFFKRIKGAKNRVLETSKKYPLIVSHGGVFRAFGKIYGLNSLGVKNCHLHLFEPQMNHPHFPWTVWEFDLSPCGTKLEKNLAQTYKIALSESESAIAS